LILAFAPADGARPLRSSHCHLTADRHPTPKPRAGCLPRPTERPVIGMTKFSL
jgi:hypothetical protein